MVPKGYFNSLAGILPSPEDLCEDDDTAEENVNANGVFNMTMKSKSFDRVRQGQDHGNVSLVLAKFYTVEPRNGGPMSSGKSHNTGFCLTPLTFFDFLYWHKQILALRLSHDSFRQIHFCEVLLYFYHFCAFSLWCQ